MWINPAKHIKSNQVLSGGEQAKVHFYLLLANRENVSSENLTKSSLDATFARIEVNFSGSKGSVSHGMSRTRIFC